LRPPLIPLSKEQAAELATAYRAIFPTSQEARS
jgi:hypothetical protein